MTVSALASASRGADSMAEREENECRRTCPFQQSGLVVGAAVAAESADAAARARRTAFRVRQPPTSFEWSFHSKNLSLAFSLFFHPFQCALSLSLHYSIRMRPLSFYNGRSC